LEEVLWRSVFAQVHACKWSSNRCLKQAMGDGWGEVHVVLVSEAAERYAVRAKDGLNAWRRND
jgi:hypothetical protein